MPKKQTIIFWACSLNDIWSLKDDVADFCYRHHIPCYFKIKEKKHWGWAEYKVTITFSRRLSDKESKDVVHILFPNIKVNYREVFCN